MATPTAVQGNNGMIAEFAIGAAPAVDYSTDIKKFAIESEDKDDSDLTFAEAIEGDTKDYTVKMTALQSTAAGSMWLYLWTNPGATFAVTYGPHGNAVPSTDKPHFVMTLKADGRPTIGAEARRGKDREEFEYEFEVLEGPTLVGI